MILLFLRKLDSTGIQSENFAYASVKKLFTYMKLTTVILALLCTNVMGALRAQQVSLSKKNAPLEQVLLEIRKQTNYQLVYSADVVRQAKPVNIDVRNMPLDDALEQLLTGQSLTYEISEKTIVIKRRITSSGPEEARKPSVSAVQTVARGKVTDADAQPLAGVTVTEKGTANKTSTDTDGTFSLTLQQPSATLVFQFLGHETKELPANTNGLTNATLLPTLASIDEVVVVGYGTMKRKNVTGAIASVKGDDLQVSTSTNFAQALQGKAAGVQVIQSTGQPGASVSVQLRSNPSSADAGVLYVVDGVPVNGGSDIPNSPGGNLGGTSQSGLNFLNPNDIESIEFLKDAASASIYGARAGAGVVLITTKRGKAGKPSIQYNGSYASQQAAKMFEVLDTRTYMEQVNLIDQEVWMQRNAIAPYYGSVAANTVSPLTPRFSQQQIDNAIIQPNAMDAITRKGYTQQHNLSISGGSENTTFYISGNFLDQRGVLLASGFKRYNGRVNMDQKISDRFKVGVNLITSNTSSPTTGTDGRYENGGIITSALYYPAHLPLIDENGDYPLNPRYTPIPNPLSYGTVDNNVSTSRLITSGYAEWEIIDGLKARGNFSYDQSSGKRDTYLPTTFSPGAAVGGLASKAVNSADISLIEYVMTYNRTFNSRHTLDGLLGYSYNVTSMDKVNAQNQNFVSDVLSYYNLGAGQHTSPGVGSSKGKTIWASYVARLTYSLDDKYTLQASLRRDGADKFAANKKWGYFPSISVGWLLSDESFMDPLPFISLLKIRASYGELGNSNFDANALAAYGTGANPVFGTNTRSTGIYLARAANPDLTWETAVEYNLGLDFGFFNNRLSGSFDLFNKTIRNLVTYVPFPADFTVQGIWSNAGTTRSSGFELGISTRNFVPASKGGFSWNTTINFSHYRSYWVERSPQALATLNPWVIPSGRNAYFKDAYGYLSNGLNNGSGNAPVHMANMIPGGIILKDLAGFDERGDINQTPDGRISAADQALLGTTDPRFNFGFGNDFSYKNFSLSIFFSGLSRKDWSPFGNTGYYAIAGLNGTMGTYGWNTLPVSLERWTFQNPENDFPTGLSDPQYAGFQGSSDFWFIDASFLRCRNITLGYRLPETWLARQKTLSGIQLSFDVQNPFTITDYPGLDPELDASKYYPLTRSFVFGLSLSF